MTNLSQMSSPESSSSNSAETTTTTTTLKRKNQSEDEERKEEATEETFVQAKSCLELDREETDESFTLCRDCDDAQDDENEDSENEEEGHKESSKDCCCRFIGWRKLRMKEADEENAATPRCLEVVGFLSPQDALEDDVKLWSVAEKTSCYDSVLSAETESEQAEAILSCVRQSFDAMIKYELEMRNKYMKENVIVWKRLMSETREMCDQCRTTLFNGHFACLKCGFAVCLRCFDLKANERNSKRSSDVRELTNWYYCVEPKKKLNAKKSRLKNEHEPGSLDFVQYIPPKVLDSVYAEFKTRASTIGAVYGSPVKMPSSLSETLSHSGQLFSEYMVADVTNLSDDKSLLRSFDCYWAESKPLVVRNVNKRLLEPEAWSPRAFAADFGELRVDLINCRNHRVLPSLPLADFWNGFEDESKRLRDLKARPMILKLKDWPTSDDFKHMMPQRFADLMDHLPVKEYVHRSGPFNLASYLPQTYCLPDLGPKLYVAYSSANTPKEGTTNLHVDISDAVNLLIYAASSKEEPSSQKDEKPTTTTRVINKTMLSLLEKSGCSSDQVKRFKSGEIPGALWHIFKPKDADEIRSFLVKDEIMKGKPPRANSDPIHDQVNYIDAQMLKRLEKEHCVTAFTIVQFLGDAIFIPAGAPHQVRNLNSCIKVALDFVSPQGIEQCLLITNQLRHLSEKHVNREDKLQVKNIIYHTVKKALSVLQ